VRAFLLGRQRHVQRPQRGGLLDGAGHFDAQRVAHVLHAHALDGQVAIVTLALRVGDVQGVGHVRHKGRKDDSFCTPAASRG
jgi:hypothetical protein